MKTRCVIYTRFSPRRNSETCESCEIQLAYCEQHAARKEWEIVGVHHDKDVTGKDEFRPVLWRSIEALEHGDVLLTYKRDRLARNVYLSEQVIRAVHKRGATIEAVAGDVEGDGPEHTMIRQVLASIAEYERKMIGMRTSSSMLQHQRNGKRMGRYAPYGYAINPEDATRVVPIDAEQPALARVIELNDEGKGHSAIARIMNQEMPGTSRGKCWVAKTVRKIVGRLQR